MSLRTIAMGWGVGLLLALGGAAHGAAHCFCQVACQDNALMHSGSVIGFVQDLGVLATYTGIGQQSDAKQTLCNSRCTMAALAASKVGVGQNACSHGCPAGSAVIAWSKVGTREWKSAHGFGVVDRQPAKSTCTCPKGWLADLTNVDGGVTANARCKRDACYQSAITTTPPNGTPIGTWGFTWGTGFIAWGTPANGGAAKCVETSPASCGLK